MIATSDTVSHTTPAVPSLLLAITNLKNGMLKSTRVPMLTIHENVKSDIGRSSTFFALSNNPKIDLIDILFYIFVSK